MQNSWSPAALGAVAELHLRVVPFRDAADLAAVERALLRLPPVRRELDDLALALPARVYARPNVLPEEQEVARERREDDELVADALRLEEREGDERPGEIADPLDLDGDDEEEVHGVRPAQRRVREEQRRAEAVAGGDRARAQADDDHREHAREKVRVQPERAPKALQRAADVIVEVQHEQDENRHGRAGHERERDEAPHLPLEHLRAVEAEKVGQQVTFEREVAEEHDEHPDDDVEDEVPYGVAPEFALQLVQHVNQTFPLSKRKTAFSAAFRLSTPVYTIQLEIASPAKMRREAAYLYFLLRAASDFFFLRTLGFS